MRGALKRPTRIVTGRREAFGLRRNRGRGEKIDKRCLRPLVSPQAATIREGRLVTIFSHRGPVSPQANASRLPVTILVGRLSAPRILRDDAWSTAMTDVEMGVDEYHRWTEPPTEMI